MLKSELLLIIALAATAALSGCGRNPGAHARSYPGTEKIEAAMAAAQPKCIAFDPKRIRATADVVGKEKFASGKLGLFKLKAFKISQAIDRADRSVPSSIFEVSDFDDQSSRAPRLAVEPACLDLKGEPQKLSLAPITRVDAHSGTVLRSQPFSIDVRATGTVSAESREPAPSPGKIRIAAIPESAILLGSEFAATFKTLAFHVSEAEDGSLRVNAEFIGVDPNLSRLFIRVEAVYGWNATE